MQAAPRSQQSLKEASDDIEASVSVDSTAVSGGHVPIFYFLNYYIQMQI